MACSGTLIGLNDKLLFDNYSSTCVCNSVDGELFVIDVVEFFKRVDINSDMMKGLRMDMLQMEDIHESQISFNKKMQLDPVSKDNRSAYNNSAELVDKNDKISKFNIFEMVYHD